MKWLRKAWHDPVGSQLISAGIIGLLILSSTLLPSVRAWVFEKLQVIGWFTLGVVLGGALGALIYRRAVRDRLQPIQTSGIFDVSITTEEPEPELNRHEGAASQPAPSPPAPTEATDFNDCFTRLIALDGRFYEAEQYRKSLVGRRVFFTGPVASVSEYDDQSILLNLKIAESFALVQASYPASFRTLAFTFQRDDVVTVVGTLKRLSQLLYSLDGESLARAGLNDVASTSPQSVSKTLEGTPDTEEAAPVVDGFTPNDEQRRVLTQMLQTYPLAIELREAHKAMGTPTPAHAERQMELLAAANVVRTRRVSDNETYYHIRPSSRDFLLTWSKDWIDLI